jgi:hypothetical protein
MMGQDFVRILKIVFVLTRTARVIPTPPPGTTAGLHLHHHTPANSTSFDLLQKSEKLNDDSKRSTFGACNRNPEVELQDSKYTIARGLFFTTPFIQKLADEKQGFRHGVIILPPPNPPPLRSRGGGVG